MTHSFAALLVICSLCGLVSCVPLVRTTHGIVEGLETDDVDLFLGIPYAAPPVGRLRWTRPQPPSSWNGTFLATENGAACPQKPFFSKYAKMGEDCLHLNVWTPKGSSANGLSLPILVFLHGGGFLSGSCFDDVINGTNITRRGVILVSVNYRLNVFGFFHHPDIVAENSGRAGNFGILDQLLALNWLQENAAAFGGDASRVTVFGHSAGACSLIWHLTVTHADGTMLPFQRIIMHSPVLGGIGFSLEEMSSRAADFGSGLGCSTADCLRQKSAEEILRTAKLGRTRFAFFHSQAYRHFIAPVTQTVRSDVGKLIHEHPFEAIVGGRFARNLSILLGNVRDEGTILLLASFPFRAPSRSYYERMVRAVFGTHNARKILDHYPFHTRVKRAGSMENSTDAVVARSPLLDMTAELYFDCLIRRSADSFARGLEEGGESAAGSRPGESGASSHPAVFRYVFAHRPKLRSRLLRQMGCFHGLDVGYTFGTKPILVPPLDEEQREVSDVMLTAWTNFAKSGDPNEPESFPACLEEGVPEWPRYDPVDRRYFMIDSPMRIVSDVGEDGLDARCKMWQSIFPSSLPISRGNEMIGEPLVSLMANDWAFRLFLCLGMRCFLGLCGVLCVVGCVGVLVAFRWVRSLRAGRAVKEKTL